VTSIPETPDAFPLSDANRVRRHPERGHYDRATIFGILDRGLVAHVAFVDDGRPVVIPMAYGRDGDRLFLHGARKGRITTAPAGQPVSVGVTLVDGIVVARSLFDSTMNYRAVLIHGRAFEVDDHERRLHALRCITEQVLPGRWTEVRLPTAQELKATTVLEVEIESASAKVREGGVRDVDEVGTESAWRGVVPVLSTFGVPVADSNVPVSTPVPASVSGLSHDRRQAHR
jgi:nitroimidazol reductase NimA-like FMN-containing flavoprotein (pyridoxamine 5'-phosphate oxidase superfamily)